MPRLSSVDRERAIGMPQSGLRPAEVARHFYVHKSTILRLRQWVQDKGATGDRSHSGRPPITTPPPIRTAIFVWRTSVSVPGRPLWLPEKCRGPIMHQYRPKLCEIASRDLVCVPDAPIVGRFWPTSVVLQGSSGWGKDLAGEHGSGDGFSSLMSPDFACHTMTDGSEYGGAVMNAVLTHALSNMADGVVGVWRFQVGFTEGGGGRTALLVLNETLNARRYIDEVLQ